MADNIGNDEQDDITLDQATAFLQKHVNRERVNVNPAMLPFLAPLILSKNADGKKALFATTPNCNHNTFDIKTGLAMINTTLGNPMNLSNENNNEFEHDMRFYVVDVKPECREDDVSDLSRNQMWSIHRNILTFHSRYIVP